MQELQIFSNPTYGEIRAVEKNNEAWFVAVDVCRALELDDVNKAISRLDDDESTRIEIPHPQSKDKTLTVNAVNEAGLYSLVLGSRKSEAKNFKRWITHEVLPCIRKNGGYITGQEQMDEHEIIANALVVAHKILAEREERLQAVEAENLLMKPKAEYFDELVDRATNINFRDSAKELGVKPNYFVNFLLSKKFIYRDQNGKLRPYQTSIERGLFVIKECYSNYGKWSGCQTLITPKGRATFKVLLGKLKR